MVRVIDGDQRVDTCRARRLEFLALQLALVGGEHAEVDALQAHRWLLQIDQLHARNGLQEFACGLDDTGDTGMLV